ncbi:unnamed protein product [Phytophthora lilii]|uniref:Unnamed protein product n=1 Tax=Phytophthora lilii TaxID=2077276 RepID=A0A9W6WR53_9STRA|nr:unnamed protein product [Phytophthora lilii]
MHTVHPYIASSGSVTQPELPGITTVLTAMVGLHPAAVRAWGPVVRAVGVRISRVGSDGRIRNRNRGVRDVRHWGLSCHRWGVGGRGRRGIGCWCRCRHRRVSVAGASVAMDPVDDVELPVDEPPEAQTVASPVVVVNAVTVKSGVPSFVHVQQGSPNAAPFVIDDPGKSERKTLGSTNDQRRRTRWRSSCTETNRYRGGQALVRENFRWAVHSDIWRDS